MGWMVGNYAITVGGNWIRVFATGHIDFYLLKLYVRELLIIFNLIRPLHPVVCLQGALQKFQPRRYAKEIRWEELRSHWSKFWHRLCDC